LRRSWLSAPATRLAVENGTVCGSREAGVIAVLRTGRRFVNEAVSYHDFAQALAAVCEREPEVCAFLPCDHKARREYGLGCAPPLPMPIGRHLCSGYLMRGRTIER
jgi:hypothetical protein